MGIMQRTFALLILGICCDRVHSQNKILPAPECYNTKTCPCCSVPCPSDDSGQCGGNCIDGYHGGKCYNRCPDNCIKCVDAQQGGGVSNCTLCKDGFYSTSSMYQCQSNCSSNCKACESENKCTLCKDGYFSTACQLNCSTNCKTCAEKRDKCLSCAGGFYINETEGTCHKCNPLCFACNSSEICVCPKGCVKGNTLLQDCITENGECLFGCEANFSTIDSLNGTYCNICRDGLFGSECDSPCNTNCASSACERLTGRCEICNNGFYGDVCDLQCPNNCSCDRNTGWCISCNDGYFGTHCTEKCVDKCLKCNISHTCLVCSDGFYGQICNKTCPENCQDTKCDIMEGNCTCKSGYTGPSCKLQLTTTVTVSTVLTVVTADHKLYVGPTVGGTLAGIFGIVSVAVLFIVIYKKRRTIRYVRYDIDLDSYKLDSRLIDVLEENDEFDPTYFTGKVDDKKKPCGQLPVTDLARIVHKHSDEFYQDEFLKLPRGLIKSCDDAKKEENVVKNRYTGIYPYDEHRVRLQPPGSDFINACYIDGYKRKMEYIASLGPTRKAMEGFQLFWRMVWQEKTDVIVMVTNLMEGQAMKCEQYWPDVGMSATYAEITVTLKTEDVYAEFVVRSIQLTKGMEQRTIHHLHYTAWPDKRVPDDITSLIEFRQKVKATGSILGGPTIVHCSAGIGRTGTYIALDILIHQGKAQKSLDIFEWVTRMREQRTSMVQTWQQYEYLHRALTHALTFHCEPVKQARIKHFIENLNDKKLRRLFKQLDRNQEKPVEGEQEARSMNKGLEGMNRDGADIPGKIHRPLLHLDKKFGENNYINAVFLNSYTAKDRFLVCQTPLPDTVKDFLTLIIQESCSCIVSMDPSGLKDQTIGEYYPATAVTMFSHPSYIFDVESQDLDTNPSYKLRRITIHFNKRSGTTSRTVYHFQFQNWPYGNIVPDVLHFLQLVQDVENIADRDSDRGPILVHCLNAAERSGLYCAVSNLVQKMKVESEVSVVNTLMQIKVRRHLAIPNKDQYIFCYRCLHQFVNSQSHSNDEAVYGNIE